MTALEELEEIQRKQQAVVAGIAKELLGALIKATPVGNPSLWKINEGRVGKLRKPKGYAGGTLQNSWELIKDGNDYILFNPIFYASIATAPYIREGAIQQGSTQFRAGIQPVIDAYDRELQRRLDRI